MATKTAEHLAEHLEFQAEVQQLLKIVTHSLYSRREFFLRELVANAVDACHKLRFAALSDSDLEVPEARIRLEWDSSSRIVVIADNGIGMTREEAVADLGTLARSGTRRFLEAAGKAGGGESLIGQFGVGFYSAFIVAEEVDVLTRKAGSKPKDAIKWSSDGASGFQVSAIEKKDAGTEVRLKLRQDCIEFASEERVRHLVRTYSEYVDVPIEICPGGAGDWQRINASKALWQRPRTEVKEREYKEFFRHNVGGIEDPLCWVHSKVEGKHEFTLLLFVPATAPYDLFDSERKSDVNLYVQRVFTTSDDGSIMPRYLRFVSGVIDSEDLPLNVSREFLQRGGGLMGTLRKSATLKTLDALERLAAEDREGYAKFWRSFGSVLKEGIIEDGDHCDRIKGLLRFSSTAETEGVEGQTSFDDYIGRLAEGQKDIYFLTAPDLASAGSSPHLEGLKSRGLEVLLLHEGIDEWMLPNLSEYKEHRLVSAASDDLELPAIAEDAEQRDGKEAEEAGEAEAASAKLAERLKQALGERIDQARPSRRLRDSAACLIFPAGQPSIQVRRLLEGAGQTLPPLKPVLEFNAKHALLRHLAQEQDETVFADWAQLLLDQAILVEGGSLDDVPAFVGCLNRLLLRG